MATAVQNFVINQGADYSRGFTIIDESTQIGLDVSSYIFRSQMRKNLSSVSNVSISIVLVDAVNGRVKMTLNNYVTSLLVENRYQYDIEMESILGVVTRIVEGIITINPNVTR
jgi:hypothetical protein